MAIETKYTYRNLAKVVLEAVTPLVVGNGEKSILSDSLVVLDVNGLPYIPGTALAGVFRHLCDKKLDDMFGYQSGRDGCGSKIIFSEARIIGHEGKVMDGLVDIDWEHPFYIHFRELPVRQHVRMGHNGSAVKGGKFDEQVVYKGTRFCFEIEMVSKEDVASSLFKELLKKMFLGTFRLGSGSSKGFGEIKVVTCQTKTVDLSKEKELAFYLSKSSSLSCEWEGESFSPGEVSSDLITYRAELVPESFFLFGTGLGDAEADMTPVKEEMIVWNKDGLPSFSEQVVLVPASSVKGALSHRTAFYWNKLEKHFADVPEEEMYVGDKNPAVLALFGSENPEIPKRGNIFFSDVFGDGAGQNKLINHVAIDQYIGGAIEGALFTEKTVEGNRMQFVLKIQICPRAFDEQFVQQAFELALKDLCSGYLPLGGGVNRGNGCLLGTLWRNDKCIFEKEA